MTCLRSRRQCATRTPLLTDPLVTVLIPSYNHGRWLAEAIESALNQTYANVELVIVDDGSSDDSVAVAERYAVANERRIRVLTHPGREHRGLSATANLGFEHTRGVYWVGLNSDDVLLPDMVERQVAALEADPALLFVYGRARTVDGEGKPVGSEQLIGEDINSHPCPLEWLLHANRIPGVTALVRREALFRFVPQLFHESLVYGDWDIWIRLAANGPIAFTPRVVASYRIHGTNLTVERDEEVARRRTLDVLETIEADAEGIGGDIVRPRVRAALRLEIVLRYYREGALDEADRWATAAFAADPSIENDAGWLKTWLLERLSRSTPPDDLPAWLLARAPAPLRASLERPFLALRFEQEAREAEQRGERLQAWNLAGRSVRLDGSRVLDPPFLRLVAKLVLGPRLTAILRGGK